MASAALASRSGSSAENLAARGLAYSSAGVLDEPGERRWEPAVEPPGVDLLSDRFDDVGAATRPVAGDAAGVVGPEPGQDPGPVQEIVDQGVDRDHAAADLAPSAPVAAKK
jgi:hypothetical protein